MSENLTGKTFVLAGGSGFLGVSLALHLDSLGAEVKILSRSAPKMDGPWKHCRWDAVNIGDWKNELEGADGIVNLAGRTVDCIKTPDHVDEILRSRVEPTRLLGKAISRLQKPPAVWVQITTAHIYGDPPTVYCTEDSAPGLGLAPAVGKAWEEAFTASVSPTQRSVVLRTSFVIGRNRGAGGGALSRLKKITRLGLGGRVGSGNQGMSWLHESDFNAIVTRALCCKTMEGVYIASSPSPVRQQEFMRTLRKAMRVLIGLPATEMMVRFGAHWLMRTDPELILYGRYLLPQRLRDEGFEFRFPTLDKAFKDLC